MGLCMQEENVQLTYVRTYVQRTLAPPPLKSPTQCSDGFPLRGGKRPRSDGPPS